MQPVVIWGDVLFVIDFSMDFCALYFTARILRRKIAAARMVIGAALCAAVGVFLVSLSLPPAGEFLLCIVSASISCIVVLYGKSLTQFRLREFFCAILLFVFLEAAAGGLMTVGFSFLNRWFSQTSWTIDGNKRKQRLFWLSAAGLTLLFSIGSKLLNEYRGKSLCNQQWMLKIGWNHIELDLPCLCDSGNLVREPISGLPVIVLPKKAEASLHIDTQTLSNGKIPRSRLVSVRTIAQEQSLFWAIHPSSLVLYPKEQKKDHHDQVRELDAYVIFSPFAVEGAIVPMALI